MFPLAGDKIKKEKKNYWMIFFNILIFLNVMVFCYGIIKYLFPSNTHLSQMCLTSAANCTQCNKGKQRCQYYDDDMVLSKDTIECNCVVQSEKE